MVNHCPTEIMIADYLTKPIQGTLFKKLRDVIMGIAPFPMEEHVEYTDKSIAKECKTTVKNISPTEKIDKISTKIIKKDELELFSGRNEWERDIRDVKEIDCLNSYPSNRLSGKREESIGDKNIG